ncbi:MAG: PEP-CTERM sorting domain-containing protein [Desulfovibrionales bacterium]|nr:PEP-CTERM sorting domain-containing protein [Desulfovibrionales bacterium]
MTWASDLTVNFGGHIYDDWRLPSTVDGLYVWGYDGTTNLGYNITSSEMGHLFYTELANLGWRDTLNNVRQSGYGLINTGDFQNLINDFYWSSTENPFTLKSALGFYFYDGSQREIGTRGGDYYAIAVRDGNVAAPVPDLVPDPIPEPATMLLIGSGLAVLAGIRIRSKKI